MLRIVMIFLVVAVAVVAVVLGIAKARPERIHLRRSVLIAAAPEKIFGLIDDFHNWKAWAPGDKDDPSIERTYDGPASGAGAISDWRGAGSTGAGRMSITESEPNRKVVVTVDFARPFVAHNLNTFTLEPAGEATRVTWSFDGSNVYMMKVMSVFVNMDKFMGKHFEEGLQNLKAAAEK